MRVTCKPKKTEYVWIRRSFYYAKHRRCLKYVVWEVNENESSTYNQLDLYGSKSKLTHVGQINLTYSDQAAGTTTELCCEIFISFPSWPEGQSYLRGVRGESPFHMLAWQQVRDRVIAVILSQLTLNCAVPVLEFQILAAMFDMMQVRILTSSGKLVNWCDSFKKFCSAAPFIDFNCTFSLKYWKTSIVSPE